MAADEAEIGADDAWEELCGKRSAIEILVTRYAGTPVVPEVRSADLDRLDQALRRVGEKQGPVRTALRFAALPSSHWTHAVTNRP